MTGEDFKEKRIFLNYTQKTFATRLGLTERTIRYYEAGEVPVSKTVEILINSIMLDEG